MQSDEPSKPTAPPLDTRDPDTARFLEGLDLRDAMIAGLAAGVNDLTSMASELMGAARLTRMERVVVICLLSLNLLIGIGVGILGFQLLSVAHTNRENGEISRAALAAIEDCTTPTGKCNQQGRAQTQEAVAQLASIAIASVECARLTRTDAAFEKCVAERAKQATKGATP